MSAFMQSLELALDQDASCVCDNRHGAPMPLAAAAWIPRRLTGSRFFAEESAAAVDAVADEWAELLVEQGQDAGGSGEGSAVYLAYVTSLRFRLAPNLKFPDPDTKVTKFDFHSISARLPAWRCPLHVRASPKLKI